MTSSPNDSGSNRRSEDPERSTEERSDAPHVSLTWSPLAYRQVADALGYIADDDPAAARRWLDQLLERIESLARFPDCGRIVPEYGREDVREIMIGS
jgi:plasmid stabilization system protein ParE